MPILLHIIIIIIGLLYYCEMCTYKICYKAPGSSPGDEKGDYSHNSV